MRARASWTTRSAALAARLPRPEAKADPMVAYTLGWLHERKGDATQAATWYRRGRDLPARLLLPLPPRGDRRPRARDGARPAGPPRALLPGQPPLRPPARAGRSRSGRRSRALDPGFARVHRNLAFAYARVQGRPREGGGQPGEGRLDREARAAPLLRARPVPGLDEGSPLDAPRASHREPRDGGEPGDHRRPSRARPGAPRARRRRRRDALPHALPRLGGRERHPLRLRGGAPRARPPPPREGRRGGGARRVPRDGGRAREHRGRPGSGGAPRGRAPPRGPRPREARPEGRGRGRLPRVRGRAGGRRRRATTGSAGRCRSSAGPSRPAATSSGWRRPGRARWTPRDRSRCGWRRERAGARTSTRGPSASSASARRAEARAALAAALEADPDNVGAVVLRRSLAPAGRDLDAGARP